MVLPAARVIESATPQPSAPSPSVAPGPAAQGNVGVPGVYSPVPGSQTPVPGSQGPAQTSQPGGQQANIAPTVQPTVPPQSNAELEQERQQRLRAEQEVNQYRQAMGQFQRLQEQNQQNQQATDRLRMIRATYDSLPSDQAESYLMQQVQGLLGEERLRAQTERQQLEQQFEQRTRVIAAPLYAEDLGKSLGMTPEAVAELKQLGDPEIMYRMAPSIKQRYDWMQSQLGQFQSGQVQMARSQEVAAQAQAGFGAFGGQTAGGDYQLEVSDDPDEAALQVLDHLRNRQAQGYAR